MSIVRVFTRSARFSSSMAHPTVIHPDQVIEEETLPCYRPQHYLPVKLSDVFQGRYQVLTKLGFGSESTVWLAKDIGRWAWQRDRFLTLKILTNNFSDEPPELRISRNIKRAHPRHTGLQCVRTVEESFILQGPHGRHVCLVYEPMRETLATLQRRLSDRVVPAFFLKPVLRLILTGLDFLHNECKIIHTDLKPENILMGIEDRRILTKMVEDEKVLPTPRKIIHGNLIYGSRNFGELRGTIGRPRIGDFGLAVDGPGPYNHSIQPVLFHAPEVILKANWSYSADIWNLGAMIWDLLEGHSLFNATHPSTGKYEAKRHLSEMITLLGPPPEEFLSRGQATREFFTTQGTLKDVSTTSSCRGLEDTVNRLDGNDKEMFLSFARKMLVWLPENRSTARELLTDPWLNSVSPNS